MPLTNSKPGTPGFSKNIATEIKAGKSQKQVVAIAYSKARGDEDDDLNTEKSGGQFNILRRKLQNFTLKKHTNGRYLVIDNKTGRTAGAGYATPEAAVRAFEREDYRRTTGRSDNMSKLDSAIASCDSVAARSDSSDGVSYNRIANGRFEVLYNGEPTKYRITNANLGWNGENTNNVYIIEFDGRTVPGGSLAKAKSKVEMFIRQNTKNAAKDSDNTASLAQKRDTLEKQIINATSEVKRSALRKELARVEDKLHGRSDAQEKLYLVYGIPKGKKERYEEVLLLSKGRSESDQDKVIQAASRDGFHSFRKTTHMDDGKTPNFGKSVKDSTRLDSAAQTAAQLHERMNLRPGAAKDADRPSHKRMFPSHTLAELKAAVAKGVTSYNNEETIEKIKKEIEARESGISVHRSTPQVSWK